MEKDNTEIKLASEEMLNMALELREGIKNTDTSRLRRRFIETIGKKQRRRNRIIAARSCAAVLVSLLLLGGAIWYINKPSGTVITKIAENVILILPNGSQITIDETGGDSLVAEIDNILVQRKSGSLVYAEQPDAVRQSAQVLYSTLEVPKGSQFNIVLADGTQVWMNSDSRLRFPSTFAEKDRKVYLEGEAYFDVAHDADKPFLVETYAQTLKVLGTQFNICSYLEDKVVYTTLVEGSVSINAPDSNKEITLTPNQQARLDVQTCELTVKTVNTKSLMAWMNGAFVFDGNTMEQMMQKLARWYDFEYTFETEEVRSLVSKGSIPIQDDVNSILKIIETTGPVKFEVSGNQIKVSMKK